MLKEMGRELKAFTMMEILVVLVMIGILATLALTHYSGYRERTLDREAQANLRLVLAAERIWRMEGNGVSYFNPTAACPIAGHAVMGVIEHINAHLNLQLPAGANRIWDYTITTPVVGAVGPPQVIGTFCAQASRNVPAGNVNARDWHITDSVTAGVPDPEPVAGACP